jgi:type I restriction enzyme S subunit
MSEALEQIQQARPRRFRPYPVYEDSGVEWLGEIPAHWQVVRVMDHSALINGYPFNSALFTLGEGMPLVRIRDLNSSETEVRYAGTPVEDALIRNGDILVGMDGEFNVGRWRGEDALLNQRMCCLRPADSINGQFLLYGLPFPLKIINDLTYSTTVKHLSSFDVKKVYIGYAPKDEQDAIAVFLDRETAKIDGLVAGKERLIELLREKRTALITRAVTRGLDPTVPMKDSGVKWLGEIPAHWEVKRLWHLTPTGRRIMYGIVLPGPNVGDGVPIVKGGDVAAARLKLEALSKTTFEIESSYVRSRLRGGDLVYAIRGSIGEVEMVPDELEGANLTQDAARIAYTPRTHGRWLLYALRSNVVFAQLEAGALGATIKGINIRDLKRAIVPVPPKAEQTRIATFLDREAARFDSLAGKVREAIDHLKEFRTALISAAVTGKIDVREGAS